MGVRPDCGWNGLNKITQKFCIRELAWDFELSFEGNNLNTGKYKLVLNGCRAENLEKAVF